MTVNHSITLEIDRLKQGDDDALRVIWDRYQGRLTRLAKKALGSGARRVQDEEDVVQSAMLSFWRRAKDDQFSELESRQNLLALLQLIVKRKASDYRTAELRQKRGSGKVRGESVFAATDGESFMGLDAAADAGQTPSLMAQAEEITAKMMAVLEDETLRKIALWKTEGHTHLEIAEFLSCSRSTVVRKLDLIRRIWTRAAFE